MTTAWLNVYPKRKGKLPAQAGGLYATKEEADKISKPHRLDCVLVRWPHDPNAVVLEKGGFSCTGELAVEIARMVSNAEAALMEGADRHSVLEEIGRYFDGVADANEVGNALLEMFNDAQGEKK